MSVIHAYITVLLFTLNWISLYCPFIFITTTEAMFVHGYSSGNAHSWPCTFCKHCSVQQRFKQKVTAPAKSQTFAEHQVEFHLWCSLGPELDGDNFKWSRPQRSRPVSPSSLHDLSHGTGFLYISNALWCIRGQNQRSSFVSNHDVVLNPDTQTTEVLWRLLILFTNVQPWDKTEVNL